MVGWGIRVDRCGCLRRPLRMSASTIADVCVDRYGCLRRPLRMSASTDADGKICGGGGEKRCVGGVWEVWEVCEGGEVWEGCVGGVGRVRGGVRGYGRMPYPPMGVLCR